MRTIVLPRKAVHAGTLILVNAQFAFEENAEKPFLVPVNGGNNPVLLEQGAVRLLSGLMEKLDGWRSITPVSGWRSRQEQESIYAKSLCDSGDEFTRKFVASRATVSTKRDWPLIWVSQRRKSILSVRTFLTLACVWRFGDGPRRLGLLNAIRREKRLLPA